MNATMTKFGYPGSLIREYPCWSVQLRPAQATLGALVLVCKEAATRFGQLSPGAFAELGLVVKAAETALADAFAYERINYLMLMMVDPDVHFHVLPRYSAPRSFSGVTFVDAGWPALPRLDAVTATTVAVNAELLSRIRSCWPITAG
jgi:diadenosine tetraphosphate (Ap4A) HIT family hydrolase